MNEKITNRKIVIVNQASNYLTVGFCNSFYEKFEYVALVTGSIHVQGEKLDKGIEVTRINRWAERPAWKKMASYLLACLWIYVLLITKYRKYEVFFVSIPPMAYLLNLIVRNRFSIVIWDVYPDVFRITGMSESHWMYRNWANLNRRSFKKAFKLFTISERMADLVEQYIDREKLIIQPIWSIFQDEEKVPKSSNPFIHVHNLENKFIVQYSGNIGLTHKVELLIEIAEKLQDHSNIQFQIIGRGPRKPYLERLVKEKNLPNCQFLPFQSDEMFPYSLSAANLGVVILDSLTAKGSVPSKSYNLMSYGIPSLYIASSDSQLKVYTDRFNHARCFSEDELNLAVVFILEISRNKELQELLSHNAKLAAEQFKRPNADEFVRKYLAL